MSKDGDGESLLREHERTWVSGGRLETQRSEAQTSIQYLQQSTRDKTQEIRENDSFAAAKGVKQKQIVKLTARKVQMFGHVLV